MAPIPVLYSEASALLSQTPTCAARYPLFCQLDSSLCRERLSNFPNLPTSRLILEMPNQPLLNYDSINTDEFLNGVALNISQPINFSL